ncbi:hypothetical protein PMIT1342_01003 [Prochlorococcus marinus str. MIT 1342]|nr:hypothetical protein PMIT1342_01003 [Prochlorococcus marinus str. MIT 1342]
MGFAELTLRRQFKSVRMHLAYASDDTPSLQSSGADCRPCFSHCQLVVARHFWQEVPLRFVAAWIAAQ